MATDYVNIDGDPEGRENLVPGGEEHLHDAGGDCACDPLDAPGQNCWWHNPVRDTEWLHFRSLLDTAPGPILDSGRGK